jgi:hypothetical protein
MGTEMGQEAERWQPFKAEAQAVSPARHSQQSCASCFVHRLKQASFELYCGVLHICTAADPAKGISLTESCWHIARWLSCTAPQFSQPSAALAHARSDEQSAGPLPLVLPRSNTCIKVGRAGRAGGRPKPWPLAGIWRLASRVSAA